MDSTSSCVSPNPNDSQTKLPKLTPDKFNSEVLLWRLMQTVHEKFKKIIYLN